MKKKILLAVPVLALTACAQTNIAKNEHSHDSSAATHDQAICEHCGPQTPRDLANGAGENDVIFAMALPSSRMNLCNIHFHNPAEHKAPAFSITAPVAESRHGGGYQCDISKTLSTVELAAYDGNQCGGVQPGDTIEVHWVYTSCDVEPGPGLGSYLSEQCANPSLRVETQVFTVVNDPGALDFAEYTTIVESGGYQQTKSLPDGSGLPIEFLGSTTGPEYTEQACSPMQVSWAVRPQCAKVNIATLSNWCAGNVFDEDHAHGVRQLVSNPKLLAPFK